MDVCVSLSGMKGKEAWLWVSGFNFTFVELDAHGSVECLAIFKLGHDNDKHATQGPVRQQRMPNRKQKTNKQTKKAEIDKEKMWQHDKEKTYT